MAVHNNLGLHSPSILGERSKWFDDLLATVGMNYKHKGLWCVSCCKKIFKSIVLAKVGLLVCDSLHLKFLRVL